jgi:hypothetical protein
VAHLPGGDLWVVEYEGLLGSCGFAGQEVIGLRSGFSVLDCRSRSPARCALGGSFRAPPVRAQLRRWSCGAGPEVGCQRPPAATVSRHASAQAALSTPIPDARLPVHAAQMSIDSTSILRSRTSGSGISACAAPSTA